MRFEQHLSSSHLFLASVILGFCGLQSDALSTGLRPVKNDVSHRVVDALGEAPAQGFRRTQRTRRADSYGAGPRKYKFDVAYADIRPDGVLRERAILINGQFPGPTIEANLGDEIEVEVTNSLTDEGTTIHWHGLLHKQSQWMDGTPSIQQCPIAPNKTFTYRFYADQVGTSWWHSHNSAQFTSGAFGALVIHDEDEIEEYDEDLGPVFLSDWYHEKLDESVRITITSQNLQPPPADNILINGKMSFPCEKTQFDCQPNAPVSNFEFNPGKKYRLRLMNGGGQVNSKLSIDGHRFTVVAHDFTPVVPYETDLVSLVNGQRVDVVVEATGAPGSAWLMRYDTGPGTDLTTCVGTNASTIRTAVAAVYYTGADKSIAPITESAIDPERLKPCAGEPLLQLVPREAIPATPQGVLKTIEMRINFTSSDKDGKHENQWTINDQTYHGDGSSALLSKAQQGLLDLDDEKLMYNVQEAGTVRVVLYDKFQFSHHPMHLHGYNFQILAEGYGEWDGTITNPENPMRRDVHILNRAKSDRGVVTEQAYTVFQFFTDNPGVWPFHCHLAWHNSAGLFTNFLVKPEDIKQFEIPASIEETCQGWNDYKTATTLTQLDAGI